MNRIGFALGLSVVSVTGCGSPVSDPEPSRGIIEEWSGTHGGGAAYSVRTLRTTAAWAAFWREVEREVPRPLIPEREMAVVIAIGERRSGGYSAAISAAGIEGGKLVVDYHESTPAPDMKVTQALTAPWAAAIVPRTEMPVEARKIPAPAPPREP